MSRKVKDSFHKKTASLLYLSIGIEGIQIFRSKHPHQEIEKQSMATHQAGLLSRIGLSKSQIAQSKFRKNYTTKHKKGRRVSINLQPSFPEKINRLQKERHLKRLSNLSHEN